MNPKTLVLDEPTAQLDPIAASDFFALLGKINRELGITVILTEHRLEDAFPYATRVLVMENGRIICDDAPEKVGHHLREKKSGMFLAMPAAMRVWSGVETKLPCPVTIRDGCDFLTERNKEEKLLPLENEKTHTHGGETVLTCDEIWFRYEKTLPDVVKGFPLTLHKGEFYAILGGNGAGKTTTLRIISGLRSAYRGTVHTDGKVGMLPQFKPVLALTIIAGVAFGGETGFFVGAVTMLLSNMLFSQGPWTSWQMFAMGIIGFLAGVLFRKGLLRRTRVSLAVFGAFASVVIYGGIMNPASMFMYAPQSISLKTVVAYYLSGLPMDLVHGFSTVVFILLAAEPMLEKMERIKIKYGLVE